MEGLHIPARNNNEGIYFNSLGRFISGDHEEYKINDQIKDIELGHMVTILNKLLNDGSHAKNILKYHVRSYVMNKKDATTLHFLAHLFVSLLTWADKVRKFQVREETFYDRISASTISGALKVDERGYLYIENCQVTHWQVGKEYEVKNPKENTYFSSIGYDKLATEIRDKGASSPSYNSK